ncbi:MAG: plasmid pRiA4b ORF-3 family protein [Mycoplasmataceae bacterium]|jgi:hypothetical protein|nr:plasmid pRiA4b ORF-3 family protein [Mycoplasmataceae bacterium]
MKNYILNIKLVKDEVNPSVTISVPSNFTFADLHYAIQMLSNWWCEHFGYFVSHKEFLREEEFRHGNFDKKSISDLRYIPLISQIEEITDTYDEGWAEGRNLIEWRTKTLKSYFNIEKILHYYYDTGDGWECLIELKDTSDQEINYPIVIENKDIWPAEDSRGQNKKINQTYAKIIKGEKVSGQSLNILIHAFRNGWSGPMDIKLVNFRLKEFFEQNLNQRIAVYDNNCLIQDYFNPFSNVCKIEQLISYIDSKPKMN